MSDDLLVGITIGMLLGAVIVYWTELRHFEDGLERFYDLGIRRGKEEQALENEIADLKRGNSVGMGGGRDEN